MSDKTTLLPCPFCGGEIPAPTRKYMSVLICPTCNAYGPGNSDMTNDELIAAWNTRAELGSGTCEKLPQLTDTVCIVKSGGAEMMFGYWRCSECGCENFEGAKHCMNCGRKVVSA